MIATLTQLLLLVLASALSAATFASPTPASLDDSVEKLPLAPYVRQLVDHQAGLHVEDIARPEMASRFEHLNDVGEVNLGITPAALWLRLDFDVRPGGEGRWLLEVAYPPLDRIEVFHGARRSLAGDLLPGSARPFSHRNHVVPLDMTAGANTVLLRVTSQSSLTVPLVLWRPHALHMSDQRLYTLYAVYLGALLALVLYNLLLYSSLRDNTYLVYVAYAGAMTIGQVSLNGIGGQLLWPEQVFWGNVSAMLGIAGAGLFGATFTRMFLATRRTMPRIDRILQVGQVCFSFAIGFALLGRYDIALAITSLVGIAFALVSVIGGSFAMRLRHPGAGVFLLAWTLLLGGGAIIAMRNMGWLPTNWLTLNSLQIGSTLELLLLSFALADRIQAERRAKEAAQAEAIAARQSSIEQLQRSERELEQRVAARTAELAEANTLLLASEQRQRELAQHDALTGLANRSLFADRLRHAIAVGQRDNTRFALLYLDLDKFKPVNDTHGHAVGDALLMEVALRITGRVRESDTVARIGGDEFVILLRRIETIQDAIDAGDSIRGELKRDFVVEGHHLSISSSIGIAVYPEHGQTEIELSRQADDAMYRAKESGRDAVCVSDKP